MLSYTDCSAKKMGNENRSSQPRRSHETIDWNIVTIIDSNSKISTKMV